MILPEAQTRVGTIACALRLILAAKSHSLARIYFWRQNHQSLAPATEHHAHPYRTAPCRPAGQEQVSPPDAHADAPHGPGPDRALDARKGPLRVPSLAENAAGAAMVQEKLPTIQGVQSVKLNPATGSVLIVYREDQVRPELLFAAVVRLMNLDDELKRMPEPVVTRELREILGSLNRMVYDRTGGLIDLWSAGLILLAAVGIQRVLAQGMRAFPAGLTFSGGAWPAAGRAAIVAVCEDC